MDVNFTLDELRQLSQERSNGSEIDVDRFVELFESLDSWMSRGGFMPLLWLVGR